MRVKTRVFFRNHLTPANSLLGRIKNKKQQGHQNRIGKKEERIVLHYDKATTTTIMMIRYPFG
jgi:hypothetical protein